MLSEENFGEKMVTAIIEELKDFAVSFSCATYVSLAVDGLLDYIFVTKELYCLFNQLRNFYIWSNVQFPLWDALAGIMLQWNPVYGHPLNTDDITDNFVFPNEKLIFRL